ncbi:MAG: 1,4-dihydroxy-2-naphthoate polyprenyltransferase, partial [Chloroflexi bacterium]|nr:1,4-dihydroxy-2-naphthoate polyprenyltransferase [Chloroflexota bacterium]
MRASSSSQASSRPRPQGWRVWWVAARPKTLFAAAGPVVAGLGLAAAQGVFRPLVALATLVAALLLQIGVNLANDAQDYQRGA